MASAQVSRRDHRRGSIAIELGLALPVVLILLIGGLQFGRVFVTRHRLEAATAAATRRAAIGNQTGQAAVLALVRQHMDAEGGQCTPLRVDVETMPANGDGVPPALVVTATCAVTPLFQGFPSVDEIRAVAAMPLSN